MATPPIQRVAIPGFVWREEPTRHVVYEICTDVQGKKHSVYRRYSEFVKLHAALSPPPPPVALPPKQRAVWSMRAITGLGGLLGESDAQKQADVRFLEERRSGLELYLRAILSARSDVWRANDAWLAFLDVPVPPKHTAVVTAPAAPPNARSNARAHDTMPGAATLRPWNTQRVPATETAATRPLTDADLLYHQNHTQMETQDAQAEQLTKILQRQRQVGVAIHDELQEHNELLGQLSTDVQQTETRMQAAQARMHRLG